MPGEKNNVMSPLHKIMSLSQTQNCLVPKLLFAMYWKYKS